MPSPIRDHDRVANEPAGAERIAEHQAESDRLAGWANLLPDTDRRLVQGVLSGHSFTALARRLGRSRYAISRRYARLVELLNGRLARLFIHHLIHLTHAERELGRLALLGGLSYRRLAARLGLTVHGVRRSLSALKAKLRQLDHEWSGKPQAGGSRVS